MNYVFDDRPANYPDAQVSGKPLKPITEVLRQRRATPHFKPDPVPRHYLETILRFAVQAPSGYNLQPWRFVVVQDEANRQRLKEAAMNQSKVGEAPVVVIACGIKGEWKSTMHAIFEEGVRRGTGKADKIEATEKNVTEFLGSRMPPAVWLNRHVMIAVTTMMLVAEAYGLDTAPMEGFDPEAVKREFGLPTEAEIVALLAIGFAQEPDKAYGGRFALPHVVFAEHYGKPWET